MHQDHVASPQQTVAGYEMGAVCSKTGGDTAKKASEKEDKE